MLSKDYRVPREIDERDLVFDARPKTAMQAAEDMIDDIKKLPDRGLESIIEQTEDMIRQAQTYEPPRMKPVDRIAEMMRDLTYGEMVEFAGEIWAAGTGEITAQNLPQILWDWAVSP